MLLIAGAFFALVIGWGVYASSVQSALCEREGIKVSTWEVFLGAKPAERVIQIK